MNKRIVSFLTAVVFVFCSVFVSASEQQASAEQVAAALVDTYGVVSVQYALSDNGEIIASGQSGVYSKTENRALTKDAMYGIGSVSKMYTTAAAMQLVERGQLDLDKPLVEYLPEFNMQDERYTQITPRMLLNHSSGLNGSSIQNAFLLDDNDTFAHDILLEKLETQTLKADPGAFSVYCNDGFTLMEIAIEKITGVSFTQYIADNLTGPLGLSYTKTPQESFDKSQLARVYYPLFRDALSMDSVNVIGTGGIYATAEELCKFGEVLIGLKPEILSKESAEAMQNPEYKNGIWPDVTANGVAYGLGWDSVDQPPFSDYGIKALAKGGDTMLSHGVIIALPEYGMTASVLSSGGSSGLNTILAEKLLLQALYEKGIIDTILPDKLPPAAQQVDMPAEFEAYSGLYGAPGVLSEIHVKDGQLVIPSAGQGPAQVYLYTGDGVFSNEDGSIQLEFTTEENGLDYLVMTAYSNVPGVGQSVMTSYNCQRVEQNVIPEPIKAAWDNRSGKLYLLVNEKPTSQLWMMTPFMQMNSDMGNGYAMGCKIVDENHAVNVFQIPMMAGRDTFNLEMFQENGIEYMRNADRIFIRQDGVQTIWAGDESICTIQPSGYVRWYAAGEDAVGKTMTVQVPEGAAFAVYKGGVSSDFTTVQGNHPVLMTENTLLAFIGTAGDVFKIVME